MIGKIKGIIDYIGSDHIVVDVSGVGYLIYCSSKIVINSEIGQKISLFIETHVREDHIHLYGFMNLEEKNLFIMLNTVKGVGNKVALALLSQMKIDDLFYAISSKDKNAFKSVSGIGPKIAERIIMELKDKIGEVNIGFNFVQNNNILDDAVSALINLGINKADANNLVRKVYQEGMLVEEIITSALKIR